ncbi:MAG: hypothetical protein L3J76_01200 [Candidatus Hydrothermae bacterium]|nr:hypothetical protein [Candidatus Hydrothermae bacterium]
MPRRPLLAEPERMAFLEAFQKAKGPRDRRRIVRYFVRRTGLSEQTLYRYAREELGGLRRRRGETGRASQVLDKVAALVLDRGLSLTLALDLLARLGEEVPSYWRAYRYLRGLNGGRPPVRILTEAPHVMHQVDATKLEEFELVERRGELYVRRAGYHRKKRTDYTAVWAFAVMDDHSRLVYADLLITKGESAERYLSFLIRAWSEKGVQDFGYPFMGVPRVLMMDRSPAARSRVFRSFLERLGVYLYIAQRPTTKGKVERFFGEINRKFTLRYGEAFEMHFGEFREAFAREIRLHNHAPHPEDPSRMRAQVFLEAPARVLDLREALSAVEVLRERKRLSSEVVKVGEAALLVSWWVLGMEAEVVKFVDGTWAFDVGGELYEAVPVEAKPRRKAVPDAEALAPRVSVEGDVVPVVKPRIEEVIRFSGQVGDGAEFSGVVEVKRYLARVLGVRLSDLNEIQRRFLENLLADRRNWKKKILREFCLRYDLTQGGKHAENA